MTTNYSADFLARLGAKAKQTQLPNRDPMTPLDDVTEEGKWEGDAHSGRKDNKTQEPIDTSKGEAGQDDSSDKQDYAKEYENTYKGKGSAATKAAIGAKLKEGIEFKVNLDSMKSLLESTDSDEAFIKESLAIFESTMTELMTQQIDTIVESAAEIIDTTISEEIEHLEEQVEVYVNSAVAEWTEENKLVMNEGIRLNLAESFMKDLTSLMESYNIVLPEDKVDLYEHSIAVGEELLEENAELKQQLDEAQENLTMLCKDIFVESFINESTLSISEAERLRNISESLEFIDETDFSNKLNKITESYIKTTKSVEPTNLNENFEDDGLPLSETEEPLVYEDPTVKLISESIRFK